MKAFSFRLLSLQLPLKTLRLDYKLRTMPYRSYDSCGKVIIHECERESLLLLAPLDKDGSLLMYVTQEEAPFISIELRTNVTRCMFLFTIDGCSSLREDEEDMAGCRCRLRRPRTAAAAVALLVACFSLSYAYDLRLGLIVT